MHDIALTKFNHTVVKMILYHTVVKIISNHTESEIMEEIEREAPQSLIQTYLQRQ